MSPMDETSEKKTGRHVKNQLNVWDALLECRIRLHKALVAANCLPLPETWQSLINTSSTASPLSLDSFQEESNHSVVELTQSLLQLHTLLAKNLTVKEKSTKKKHVRKEVNDEQDQDQEVEVQEDEEEEKASEGSEEIGEDALDGDELHDLQENTEGQTDQEEEVQQTATGDSKNCHSMDVEVNEGKTEDSDILQVNDVPSIDLLIQQRMQEFTPKKNYILQEWFHRTRFSAAQGLESFEQPPLTQITAILGNKKRLIKRTQLKRCQYNIVGKSTQESSHSVEKKLLEQSTPQSNNKSTTISDIVAHESQVDAKELNYDGEIFNDDDFYHQLLKELIDSKTGESSESISLSKKWLAIEKMRGKMRGKVDTRASKGRKIRFKVHKEIVNFMAPVPLTCIDETSRGQIFSSIFAN